jgi:hypothetical protein
LKSIDVARPSKTVELQPVKSNTTRVKPSSTADPDQRRFAPRAWRDRGTRWLRLGSFVVLPITTSIAVNYGCSNLQSSVSTVRLFEASPAL